MKLGIYTIEKTLFEGDVKEVIAETTTGEIAILENHIPLISRLKKADLVFTLDSGEKKSIPLNKGFMEVKPLHRIVVLADAD